MSDEQQDTFAEVLDLLDRIDPLLGALAPAVVDGDEVRRSVAAETSAMHRARANIAQEKTLEMRRGLEDVRRRAVEVAESMRRARAERAAAAAPSPWWEPLRAACTHLLESRLDHRDDVHRHLLRAARAAVPAAAGVGIVWCDADGALVALHDDDPVLATLEAHDPTTGTGPGRAALAGEVVTIPDLPADRRWPDLVPALRDRDVRSLLAVRLTAPGPERDGDRAHVAAVWHAPRTGAFDGPPTVVAGLLAQQTALVLAGARRAGELALAVDSRDVIGQAKGILVDRDHISPQEAFDRLVDASQTSNVKLRDVAAWLVEETRRS